MGQRGPKPQPKALALMRGTYRPDRGAKNQAAPMPEMPPCPSHLDDEAKKEWRRIAKELLVCGLLSRLDRAALAGYCVTWARWMKAETELRAAGLMITTPNGYQQPSPWLAVANKSLEQLRGFAAEFGMTPATRSRVEALPVPKAGDRALEQKRALLFGEGNGKLAKYLRHEEDEAAKEQRFFGDAG